MGFDNEDESIAGGFQVGDLSIINTNVYPDGGALDELSWKQVIADGRWVVIAGRVDQSFHLDVNRVANDAFRKLQGFALVNNLSIPFPLYGGIGGILTWKATDWLTLRVGGGESGSDEPWQFWKTVGDGNWYQLVEVELGREVPLLGHGHYRVTPWHNRLDGRGGWGVGLNVDQELGLPWLVAFLRLGWGDADVTPNDRFASFGLGVERPFGRDGDLFTIGFAWTRPSDPSERAETIPAARLVASHLALMTRHTAQVLIAGPAVVERALGETLSKEELGGSQVHMRSGVVDVAVEDEEEAFQTIRRFLSYLPTHVWELPPRTEPTDDPNRRDEELLSAIPRDRRIAPRCAPMRSPVR